MGTYRESPEDIQAYICDGLDAIHGEVFKEDFKKAVKLVLQNYESWSDEEED